MYFENIETENSSFLKLLILFFTKKYRIISQPAHEIKLVFSRRFWRKGTTLTMASFFSSSSDTSTFTENRWSKYTVKPIWPSQQAIYFDVIYEEGCVPLKRQRLENTALYQNFIYIRIMLRFTEEEAEVRKNAPISSIKERLFVQERKLKGSSFGFFHTMHLSHFLKPKATLQIFSWNKAFYEHRATFVFFGIV